MIGRSSFLRRRRFLPRKWGKGLIPAKAVRVGAMSSKGDEFGPDDSAPTPGRIAENQGDAKIDVVKIVDMPKWGSPNSL